MKTITTLLCAIILVSSGCQIWKIVKMRGSCGSGTAVTEIGITPQEDDVISVLHAVAINHNLVPYPYTNSAYNSANLLFIATNYDGHFGLSFQRMSASEFEITLSESPAFRRSKLSHEIEEDLKRRIPNLRVNQD